MDYFEKLSLIRLLDAEESQRALISKLNRLYKRAAQEIEEQIQEIFEAYSKYAGLSADKAREYLSKAEQDEVLSKLKELLAATDDPQEQGDLIARINAKSYRYRITRLEATKDNAYAAIKKVGQVEKQEGEKLLQSAYGATYYQTIHDLGKALNIGISFSIVSPQQIWQAVQRPWIGKTFSERVWENTSKLASKAEEVITSAVMSGASVTRAAEQLQKYSKQGIYGATRLVRTEMNHICNQAELDVYKDLGIDKYKYLATLDYRTCEVCQPLDNRTFKTEQAMTGSNYPPMHPNCRCTTTIDTNFSSRWANDGDKKYKADGDITYAQWRENMTDEQREAFDTYVKQWRNRASDEKQYKRYVERLGSANMPKTFDKFQELKYTQYEKWEDLKNYYRSRGTNMISAFTSFNDYRTYRKEIQDEIIGLITVDGVEIKSQSKHFIERVFGTTEDPNTKRARSGVKLEDVKEALLKGETKHRDDSLRYLTSKCIVSVNNKTGKLIQTSPK